MPFSLKRLARLAGLAAAILLVPWLCSFTPLLAVPFLAVWPLAVYLDFYSTWQMYQLNPEKFQEDESNEFFVAFYEKLGFKRGVPVFLTLVEIPEFIFIALVCVPLITAFFSLDAPPLVGFGATAAGLGYAHLYAWWVNHSYVSSKKGLSGDC